MIIAGIYLLLPFSFGIMTQRYSTTFFQNENKTLGDVLGVQLNLINYHRGWFHSTATIQVEQKMPSGDFETLTDIPIVITHGPSYRFANHFLTGFGMITANNFQLVKDSPFELSFQENVGFNGERGAFIIVTKKQADATNNLKIGSLVLHMRSNVKADHFLFRLVGNDLQFQDPTQSISAGVQQLTSTLEANYLGERNWQLTLGLALHQDQLTAALPDDALTSVTVNADTIDVGGVHFDTQKIAKLLEEVIVLKQASDEKTAVKPTAWMAVFQHFLTEMIHNDTWANITGLSITTPMGQLQGHYDVSFPTLQAVHDYFDVATRNVSTLQIAVPSWTYTDAKAHKTFSLKALQYDAYNNTVFARHSKLIFDKLDVQNTQAATDSGNAIAAATIFSVDGFSYQSALSGDISNLSQTMQWQIGKFCFSDKCFQKMNGELEFSGMNYPAFRGIAAATQKVVQYNPDQSTPLAERWMDLANAYAQLIMPQTKVVITHDMNTPEGEMKLHGELSWPNLSVTAGTMPTLVGDMHQASYELHLLFPATYVDTFLSQQAAAKIIPDTSKITPMPDTAKDKPSFEEQTAKFLQYALSQGYLKKVGSAYVMDLTGKGDVVTINGVAWKVPG